jgi:hypothetical protein
MLAIKVVCNIKDSLIGVSRSTEIMLSEKSLEDVIKFSKAGCGEDTNNVYVASRRYDKLRGGAGCKALQHSAELVGDLSHIFSRD